MKPQVQKKPVSDEEHQKMIRSVAGTMAIEGLTMSEASRRLSLIHISEPTRPY